MYKIIASDLDETLLDSKSHVSEKDREYIKKAKEKGVKFVCASGRGFPSFQNTLQEIGLYNLENEYTISFNGGCITENKNNHILSYEGISWELANLLYQKGMDYDVCIHVYTIDNCYIYRLWDIESEYLGSKMKYEETFETNLNFLKEQKIVKLLYVNTDRTYLQKIAKDLEEDTKDCCVTYSSNRYLEFNHLGVNKGSGLKKLCDLLKIDIKDTIAIGDNFNDLSMIQEAGLGVGVANTPKDMQPLCDFITTSTNNESAIAEVIEKFILTEKGL